MMMQIDKYLRNRDVIYAEGYLLVTKEKILLADEAGLKKYMSTIKRNRIRNSSLRIYQITLKRIR